MALRTLPPCANVSGRQVLEGKLLSAQPLSGPFSVFEKWLFHRVREPSCGGPPTWNGASEEAIDA